MNAAPHTHEIEITRQYPSIQSGYWLVKYGDTQVRFAGEWRDVPSWSPKHKRRVISRAVRKAIKQHDQGSVDAGEQERQRLTLIQLEREYNDVVAPPKTETVDYGYRKHTFTTRTVLAQWGRELLTAIK